MEKLIKLLWVWLNYKGHKQLVCTSSGYTNKTAFANECNKITLFKYEEFADGIKSIVVYGTDGELKSLFHM